MSKGDQVYPVTDLVPLSDMGKALQVGRTTPYKWARRYADFPEPVIDFGGSVRLWSLSEVRDWAGLTENGRPV